MRSLDGRTIGTVEEVELEPLSGQSATVVVQRRGGLRSKPMRLRAGSIALVDPWRRLVVTSLPNDRRRTGSGRRVSRWVVRTGHGLSVAAAGGVAAGRHLLARTREAAPPLRRIGVWVAARSVYLLAFLGWLYGVAVFAVSRVAVRLLLAAAKALAWICVAVGPRSVRLARRAARKSGELAHRLLQATMR